MSAGGADVPGWVYVLTHPAWDKIGMVKIGKTSRDPRTRSSEIASVSGLLAPCSIAYCAAVPDIATAEKTVHRMLGDRRVKKRREMFRVDVATARQVIDAVAGSSPAEMRAALPSLAFRGAKPRHPQQNQGRGRRRGIARSLRIRLLGGAMIAAALALALIRFAPGILR